MKKRPPVRIETHVETQWSGAESTNIEEFDRDEWEAMTPEQQEKKLQDMADEALNNACSAGARVLPDKE